MPHTQHFGQYPGLAAPIPPFGLEDQTAKWELGGRRLRRFLDRTFAVACAG